jgi:prepilin-type N-terminal cleavage/methylation domain-containing protein
MLLSAVAKLDRVSTCPRGDRGFTLIEMLIILFIVGILTATGIPSLLSLLNNKKLDNALTQVETALKETQKNAIKKSRTCTLTIPTGTGEQLLGNCLNAGNQPLPEINISRPAGLATIGFDFKGRVSDPTNRGTIVFSLPDGSGSQRCLAISNGIGLIRSGKYDGTNCNTI